MGKVVLMLSVSLDGFFEGPKLRLLETRTFGSGVVLLHYARA